MKINILFFYFLILFYSFNLYATNIRVVDLEKMIQNNNSYILLYSQIESDQKKYTNKFNEKETELSLELGKIEKLKLILNKSELDKEINNYNELLNNFNFEIKKFNTHYEKQINKLKNVIVNEILKILKKYSLDNQIDLILDSNHYILSNNSININDFILEELNKLNIETGFEQYK